MALAFQLVLFVHAKFFFFECQTEQIERQTEQACMKLERIKSTKLDEIILKFIEIAFETSGEEKADKRQWLNNSGAMASCRSGLERLPNTNTTHISDYIDQGHCCTTPSWISGW